MRFCVGPSHDKEKQEIHFLKKPNDKYSYKWRNSWLNQKLKKWKKQTINNSISIEIGVPNQSNQSIKNIQNELKKNYKILF